MQPICAAPKTDTPETEQQKLQLIGVVHSSDATFPDRSAREMSAIKLLHKYDRSACIERYLHASRDAERAVDVDGKLNENWDEQRYVFCEFYRAEVEYWRGYYRSANAT